MLEMKTKWFTNSLAKQSMLNNDFIACNNNQRLYVVSYGNLTTSGKNTYNVVLKDSDNKVLEEYSNLYLDAITKLILGSSPKSKANKDANEAIKETKAKKQTKEAKECLYLTFDEAFEKACKQIETYKPIAMELGKYDSKDAITLTMIILNDAKIKERQRAKEAKKNEEIQALLVSLDIAKKQGNTMIIDAINEMIANKERE